MEVLKHGVVTGSTLDIGTELYRLLLKQGYRFLNIRWLIYPQLKLK